MTKDQDALLLLNLNAPSQPNSTGSIKTQEKAYSERLTRKTVSDAKLELKYADTAASVVSLLSNIAISESKNNNSTLYVDRMKIPTPKLKKKTSKRSIRSDKSNYKTKYSEYDELYRYCSIPEEIRVDVEGDMKSWNFDQEKYSSSDLAILAAVTLIKKKVDRLVVASVSRIGQFCVELERAYQSQPYHNFRHGFTVLHMTGRLLSRMDLMNNGRKQLNELHRVGLLLAALCHDIFPEGRTNHFDVMASRQVMYSNDATNEKMHAARTLQTVRKLKLFDGMEYGNARLLKRVMQDLILSTDMKEHEKILAESKMLDIPKDRRGTYSQQLLYSKVLIHAADIGNPTLVPKLAKQWATRILNEFTDQMKEEERSGSMDSKYRHIVVNSPDEAKLHLDFIHRFVHPTWHVLDRLMPPGSIKTYLAAINENVSYWDNHFKNLRNI